MLNMEVKHIVTYTKFTHRLRQRWQAFNSFNEHYACMLSSQQLYTVACACRWFTSICKSVMQFWAPYTSKFTVSLIIDVKNRTMRKNWLTEVKRARGHPGMRQAGWGVQELTAQQVTCLVNHSPRFIRERERSGPKLWLCSYFQSHPEEWFALLHAPTPPPIAY